MATLNLSRILPLTAEELHRFFRYLSPGADGCLIWRGPRHNAGYGFPWFRSHQVLAHRLAWVIHHQQGLSRADQVLHHCDVRACCLPDHIFIGTPADNQLDKASKGRGTKSDLGLPYGVSQNNSAKHPFRARVKLGGQRRNLGYFDTAEEAGRVAMDFKIAYLAEAGLNYQEKK